ncbi:MAG TPA: DUF488 domain-containing protein [Patescibacteria group bacterium]|nr:DUF488 domain-containing protein [Patescibacteria group bacterium]
MIKLKRVYEPVKKSDGFRVLVDRLWPRGVSKQKAKVDVWMKEIGPTDKLRKWFGHDPKRWNGFRTKYKAELKKNPELKNLKALAKKHKNLTLVYGAKDEEHNQAVVLKEFLK